MSTADFQVGAAGNRLAALRAQLNGKIKAAEDSFRQSGIGIEVATTADAGGCSFEVRWTRQTKDRNWRIQVLQSSEWRDCDHSSPHGRIAMALAIDDLALKLAEEAENQADEIDAALEPKATLGVPAEEEGT